MPELTEIIKPLSDQTRYNLLKLLLSHDYCVGALAKRLNISKSAVSQHLKIMRNAGIVKGDKRGYFTHYYVDRDLLKKAGEGIIALSELTQVHSDCPESAPKNHLCCQKTDEKDKV